MKTTLLVVIGLAGLIAAGGWLGTFFGWLPRAARGVSSSRSESITRAPAEAEAVAVALGRLEPAAGMVNVAGPVGDRLAELKVSQGERVKAGAVLAVLESHELRQRELAGAELRLSQARRQWEMEKEAAAARVAAARLAIQQAELRRHDLEVQQRQLDWAAEELAQARADLADLEGLPADLASPREVARKRLDARRAETEWQSAQMLLEKARKGYELGLEAAQAELSAAESAQRRLHDSDPISPLEIQRELAEFQLKQSTLSAPRAGTVVRVFLEPGEALGATPVLQLADLDRMVVVAEVYETDLKHVFIGQQVRVASPAFDFAEEREGQAASLTGRVERIGRVVSGPALKPVDPFAPADRHVVEVRIALDELPADVELARLANLQVTVRFLPAEKRAGSAPPAQ